ncbi:nuclear transport factor 2 family protein [Novosphingobium panipatense]|uniref:nuclear transport factor 2 family protein n=1 Tax=Novosphingobium TaxID=165696 RepID=UPI0018EBBD19|nr:nuclear transport factor 2 family protein [Novosphingobium sp. HII-3]
MDHDLQAMIDREAIRNCVARLARGEDRRSAALIRACWWPDARFDYGVHGGDFDAYLAWVVPGADAIKNTQHLLGQTYIELASRDRARAETHVFSYHRVDMGAGDRDTCIGGRYLDTFEKRNGEWRIVGRIMLYDWEQDWGAAADWSKGVMGYPFTADHFPGRAKNDFSEGWFSGELK